MGKELKSSGASPSIGMTDPKCVAFHAAIVRVDASVGIDRRLAVELHLRMWHRIPR